MAMVMVRLMALVLLVNLCILIIKQIMTSKYSPLGYLWPEGFCPIHATLKKIDKTFFPGYSYISLTVLLCLSVCNNPTSTFNSI